jgi:hypothetical protein
MVGVLSMILIAVRPEITLFLMVSFYVVASLIWNLVRVLKSKPSEAGVIPVSGKAK